MRMRIGFLGLGTMGAPLANNLRKAGYTITVWNRTRAKTEPLVRKGAAEAGTPRQCATGQDLVFTCLSDERALDAVLDGEDGVLAALKAGDVLVDCSTAGTRQARDVRRRVQERGAGFVAAPLLGSRAAAEKAQLIIVAGGPAELRERARPALHAVSARLVELEDAVQAALALGASGGLDVAKMIDTLQASGFHSPLYLMKGEQILQGDWSPRFALSLAEKDQRLAQEAAAEQGARMPINAAVRQLFAEAVESGRGDKDMCAVADLCFQWAKISR